jgi:hypothetical protein
MLARRGSGARVLGLLYVWEMASFSIGFVLRVFAGMKKPGNSRVFVWRAA